MGILETALRRSPYRGSISCLGTKSPRNSEGNIFTVIIPSSESDTLSIRWQTVLVEIYTALVLTGPPLSRWTRSGRVRKVQSGEERSLASIMEKLFVLVFALTLLVFSSGRFCLEGHSLFLH